MSETRTVWRPDVTVATIVPQKDRFLMVEESIHGKLVLNQPAGHLEPKESLLDAARRETLEETGWSVELTAFIGVYQWSQPHLNQHFIRFAFAGRPVYRDSARELDQGIVRALWLTHGELQDESARLRSPLVMKSFNDYLAGQRLPLTAVQSLLTD